MRWSVLLFLMASGCASTVDPEVSKQREQVALERVTLANRAFLSCVFQNAEKWVDSDEPVSVVTDLAIARCSSERANLQVFLHSYNRVYWDPNDSGGALLKMASDATRSGIDQFTSAAKNAASEFLMELRIKKASERRDN